MFDAGTLHLRSLAAFIGVDTACGDTCAVHGLPGPHQLKASRQRGLGCARAAGLVIAPASLPALARGEHGQLTLCKSVRAPLFMRRAIACV
jgi:hypothetical protein